MTLTEYVNQKDPERMPKVILKHGEYLFGTKLTCLGGTEVRQQVFIKGFPYEYCMVNNWPVLYTTDTDGNPKKPSCFRINIEL